LEDDNRMLAGGINGQSQILDNCLAEKEALEKKLAAPAIPEGWVSDPDSIPKYLIEVSRSAICKEFGNNGTDGYYKRILAKIFEAMLNAAPKQPQVHDASSCQCDER